MSPGLGFGLGKLRYPSGDPGGLPSGLGFGLGKFSYARADGVPRSSVRGYILNSGLCPFFSGFRVYLVFLDLVFIFLFSGFGFMSVFFRVSG